MEENPVISELVQELLLHYDCVIIPEFGGFVTEYRSARIDKELNIIHPPSKDLRFNAQLKKNDGLLASVVAEANALTHEAATEAIKKSVDSYFSELEGGRSVKFDRVGILYLDSQKNIQFKADESVNYLLESFRLKKVYAQPIANEAVNNEPVEADTDAAPTIVTQKPIEEPAIAETKVLPLEPSPVAKEEVPSVPVEPAAVQSTASGSSKRWLAAALIPLLLYLGFVAIRSDVIRDGQIQMSDLNPFKRVNLEQAYHERAELPSFESEELDFPSTENTTEKTVPVDNPALTEDVFEAETPDIAAEDVISEPIEETPAVNTYVAPKTIATLEFHVIGGCFGELGNAEKLVARLREKGFSAYIIDNHRGLHRVAYGSYALRQEALTALKAVKEEEQSEAWLLRKK